MFPATKYSIENSSFNLAKSSVVWPWWCHAFEQIRQMTSHSQPRAPPDSALPPSNVYQPWNISVHVISYFCLPQKCFKPLRFTTLCALNLEYIFIPISMPLSLRALGQAFWRSRRFRLQLAEVSARLFRRQEEGEERQSRLSEHASIEHSQGN